MALPAPETRGLEQVLRQYTREGILYEKLDGGKVRCFSCGHRCIVPEGKHGICLVRYNQGGTLYVPHGYVGALQLDPVEKKPFFHAYPGSLAMSFGMLGCDYHCPYCVTGETRIVTSQGPKRIDKLYEAGQGVEVYTHSGGLKKVRQFFRHTYEGTLLTIKPRYLPPLRVTPEHEFLVSTPDGSFRKFSDPIFVKAGALTKKHCVVVPRTFSFSEETTYDVQKILSPVLKPFRPMRKITAPFLEAVLELTREGYSSREIGRLVGKDPSHVRHLRSKIQRGIWNLKTLDQYPGYLVSDEETIRFAKEHSPGIPREIPLDEELAELMGYYTAEGSITDVADRVQSADLVFSLGPHEECLARKIGRLLTKKFKVKPSIGKGPTGWRVFTSKASLARFFQALCGRGAKNKTTPEAIFRASRSIIEKFIDAHVEGDGHVYENGTVSVTTVSEDLAFGIYWLALKTGRFPSIYEKRNKKTRFLLGREVHLSPKQYTIVWMRDNSIRKWLYQDNQNYYLPIQSIRRQRYQGSVYNMEVAEDHSYLAQFLATHNCQNWYTSQSLRDPTASAEPSELTPRKFAELAKSEGARIVTSTYNEPLITSEWAVEIFREAKKAGLITSYVSNGNGTPEVLKYIRPWVDLYKVDLKGFQDKRYREMGGVLSVVLETIARLYEMGFWLEIVTLFIPGFNDSDEEMRNIARFIAGVSKDIPWHVTAFHKDYKMQDPDNTPVATLIRAYDIGKEEGLNFVYPGNLPGRVGTRENTYCPGCNELLIERFGFQVRQYRLKPGGLCPACGATIHGRWD